jgi:putative ATPase
LNSLELAAGFLAAAGHTPHDTGDRRVITLAAIETALQKKALQHDKSGEEHYNLISAFHKSMRGSDPDAALYWLGRMLTAGEDPLYVARRMVRFATEDIGMADPYALRMALSGMEAYRFLGSPEGDLALAQSAIYLATAPKSNSTYRAYDRVKATVEETGGLPTPLHIRNAPTKLMAAVGHGKDYRYAHDYKDAFVAQDYLPETICRRRFYEPTDRGFEHTIQNRLKQWRQLKNKHAGNAGQGKPSGSEERGKK